MDLDASEVRVLGCLVEKQRTTPDQYPLSMNALRLACNQSTNRDPVVSYTEDDVRAALGRLGRRRYTRLASGHTSRASKYRHLLDEALGLDAAQQAVLAVLMLRGPQTPGELKTRTDRMQGFASLDAVHATLGALIERGFVLRHERRPGQKEERYTHRLSEDTLIVDRPLSPAPGIGPASDATHEPAAAAPAPAAPGVGPTSDAAPAPAAPESAAPRDADEALMRRVGALEREVAELRSGADRVGALEREVAELREALAALRAELGA